MPTHNLHTFEKLFKELFKPLCAFALKYVPDLDDAKGIVHEVFVSVWEKFDSVQKNENINLKSYLYTAVKNRCLNYLRDRKKLVSLEQASTHEGQQESTNLEAAELELKIENAIASLPEKCREVFELNRKEGLKYAQIAEQLGISLKTVEAQMSKALTVMREHLSEFLSLIFFLYMT